MKLARSQSSEPRRAGAWVTQVAFAMVAMCVASLLACRPQATSTPTPTQDTTTESRDDGDPRLHLPMTPEPFKGKVGVRSSDSTKDFPKEVRAPKGAPNILLIMPDDVGFGASSPFGGPIPTPALERIAAQGVRYNQFHTTALCSPTRAALIAGRNHHSLATGTIMETGIGYPGYHTLMPRAGGTVAKVLNYNGYNTAWYGKNHNVPA